MSLGETRPGARWRDIRNLPGSLSWRTLIWPKASTIFCWERIWLPVTSSSSRSPEAFGIFADLVMLFLSSMNGGRHDMHAAPDAIAGLDELGRTADRRQILAGASERHLDDLLHPARAHYYHAVGQRHRLVEIVG